MRMRHLTNVEYLAGILLLVSALGVIAFMWARSVWSTFMDAADERAESIADHRYRKLIERTEVDVHPVLIIVDDRR